MMYSMKKYFLAGILIISVVITLFLSSRNWESQLFSWVNNKMAKSGWEIKIDDASISIFGTNYLTNVVLSHSSGSLILVEKLTFNLGYISSIIYNPIIVFDLITMEGLNVKYEPINFSKNLEYKKNKINYSVPY